MDPIRHDPNSPDPVVLWCISAVAVMLAGTGFDAQDVRSVFDVMGAMTTLWVAVRSAR